MNKAEIIAKMELLKLKHKLAIELAIELTGHPDYTREQVVDEAFDIAGMVTERIRTETDIFALKLAKEVDQAETEFDPVQHFLESVMGGIARAKGQVK